MKGKSKSLLYCRVFLWVCTLMTALTIFGFSAQEKEESDSASGAIVEALVEIAEPSFEEMSPDEQERILGEMNHLVRKTAHFMEYAALGFFVRLLMGSYSVPHGMRRSWLAGALYAGTDELHQGLVPGRAPMWQDVLLDSAGVLAGILAAQAARIFVGLWRKRRGRAE